MPKAPELVPPGLYRVRKGMTILVPGVTDPSHRVWAKQGQYLDLTHPVAAACTQGQAYKLEKVKQIPAGRGNVPLTPQKIQKAMRDNERAENGEEPPTKTEEQANAGGVEVDDLPGLAEGPAPAPEPEPVNPTGEAAETESSGSGTSGDLYEDEG